MLARRPALALAIAIAVVAAGFALLWTTARARPQRRAPLHPPAGAASAVTPGKQLADRPVEEWTARLIEYREAGAWEPLRRDLEDLRARKPQEFRENALGYLLARVLVELEEYGEASRALAPFLADGSPFEPLARRHQIAILAGLGDETAAAGAREELIFEHPDSIWRGEEIDAHLAFLAEEDARELIRFAERLRPSAPTALRRELDARIAEAQWELGQRREAIARALRVLRGGTNDDPAERAFRLLDDSAVLASLAAEDLALVGDAASDHRHYDAAIEILERALDALPAKAPDLLFAIGRSQFGAERFDEAEATYLRGASSATDPERKATFYFHAARAAQLRGEDDRAIRHMTRAIGIRGNFDATSAALTQRMRTKLRRGDIAGGVSDLRQLERLLPKSAARAEASIQLATYLV
ncbi:MAG TPA: hypothetical protein VGF40_11760, partial [Thermoanaerobaculia bacterium]